MILKFHELISTFHSLFQFELTQFIHEVLFAIYLNILFITSWVLPEKSALFWPLTNTNHLILSVEKPSYLNRRKSKCNCQNLQRYKFDSFVTWRFPSYKKIQIKNHQSQPTNMTFWTAWSASLVIGSFFCSQTRCLAVSDPVCSVNHFSVLNIIYIYSLLLHKLK